MAVQVASYLDVDAIVAAGARRGAQALHPGYGFLSENPALARACAAAGRRVGRPAARGDRADGRQARAPSSSRAQAGVPVVPGLHAIERGDATRAEHAAAGQGGSRRRRARDARRRLARPSSMPALESARREAEAGFGDGRVLIERFVADRAPHRGAGARRRPRDRACTSASASARCSAATRRCRGVAVAGRGRGAARHARRRGDVALARACGYVGAGTVEFIADADDPAEHYFLEMNTRLQVEHPVTELVTGSTSSSGSCASRPGSRSALSQTDITLGGHAIEARIYAEDATRGFLPAAGRVLALPAAGRRAGRRRDRDRRRRSAPL